jgi:Ca-activated chloride channel family protein
VRGTANLATALYAPSRDRVAGDTTVYVDRPRLLPSTRPAVAIPPVRYRNRERAEAMLRPVSLAGWYYVGVKVGRAGLRTSAGGEVPFELDLVVSGAPEAGPRYSGALPAGGVFGNGGGTVTGPGTPRPGATPGRPPGRTGTPSAAGGPSGDGGGSRWPWYLAGGAAVALAAGLGGWLLGGRRRRGRDRPRGGGSHRAHGDEHRGE